MTFRREYFPSTPRSKTLKLLRDAGIIHQSLAPEVRQNILFTECISEEVKEERKANNQDIVRTVIVGETMDLKQEKTNTF